MAETERQWKAQAFLAKHDFMQKLKSIKKEDFIKIDKIQISFF